MEQNKDWAIYIGTSLGVLFASLVIGFILMMLHESMNLIEEQFEGWSYYGMVYIFSIIVTTISLLISQDNSQKNVNNKK